MVMCKNVHLCIIVYRRAWFFGLIGPKRYVVRCFECDFCSDEYKTRAEAFDKMREIEGW